MKKISIIEDDQELADRLVSLLGGSSDFEVIGNFGDAETLLEQEFWGDMLLVDLRLPSMNGAELIATVKRKRPEVVCVAHTVVTDRKQVLAALRAGADGYLVKGLSGRELVSSLNAIEKGGAPLTPQVARLLIDTFRDSEYSESPLSSRESEVLQLLSEGHSYKEAAQELILSVHTIHDHVKKIYHKLKVGSRGEAVAKARQLGWL